MYIFILMQHNSTLSK